MENFSLFFVTIVFVLQSIAADGSEPECGISEDPPSHHRIINGTLARKGQLPWIAYTNTFTLCTASIISRNYVLTAGHCVVNESGDVMETAQVKVGTIDQFDTAALTVVSEEHGVIPHPKYNATPPCDKSPAYDIAIIKLSKSLNFTEYVRPICLKKTFEETESDVALISGYGAKIWFHLPCSPCPMDAYDGKLRWGTSKFVDEQQCRRKLSEVEQDCLSGSPIVCARGIHQVETFLGDSGGPLAVVNSNKADGKKQYMQVGVTSTADGDNFQGIPSTYTRVSSHCDWIAEVTGGEVNCRD
ncbi:trypsin domain-containing protein [Ditylenchus destructor]|uniref:Trypsin domain-containing protein n=1 Tax=Ditylenchus destructor TaxID=166010 RepID=A0AAD4QYI2_9BILA|nr:trypsin domain-containing protein [Ditylenchus destructor]